MIRDALILDQVPDWQHYEVLGVEGTFTERSSERPARLDGWVTFKPYQIQASRCMTEAVFITGLRTGEEYNWSTEHFAYWSWDAGEDGCTVENRSQIAGRAVQSSERIRSATIAFVLANSGELLRLAYEFVESEIGETEPAGRTILAYREIDAFEIDRIEIGAPASPESGFTYSATYRAPGRPEGPAVVFSVTEAGFLIHDVGRWIA